ncbi:MAG TPA: DUF4159 domain-containing protein [Patescibacteria group bacterium]|nr:DUF4159 domain-containing protein [Patescibacteria group bacterium]
MFSLAGLSFLSPFLLAALAGIPVLWWILRVMPPRPKAVKFPAFFLLQDLKTDLRTPAHTPWWLLLLRSIIVALFIFAMAEPIMKLSAGLPGSGGNVMVAIDNGWASAANWLQRQEKLREFLSQVRRSDRPVIFLLTAADEGDGKLHYFGPMEEGEAQAFAAHLKPVAWPTDHQAAAALAAEVNGKHKISHTVFLSDGVTQQTADGRAFMDALRPGGGLTLVKDEKVNTPYILRKKAVKPGSLDLTVERLNGALTQEAQLLAAYAPDGSVLDNVKVEFGAGQRTTDVKWDVLNEMRSKVSRIGLQRTPMASATYLTDSQWQQRPVGIIADIAHKESDSFLNEVYYLKRALETGGGLEIDDVDKLLGKSLSAIIWPDAAPLTAIERVDLLKWVEQGGFLIRFAGPNLAANPEDPLLPVRLRFGLRALEGAMTWEKPVKLNQTIPEGSPLLGLEVPPDVLVTRQVLAEPTPETFEHTWLQLDDGTPLLTGAAIGKGEIVLIHTTAGTDWSNFCYSGLYVAALQRMISLSTGISDYKAESLLSPFMVLDGFGKLQPPGPKSIISALDPKKGFTPTAVTPPGLYGTEKQFSVFNLGDALPQMVALGDIPAGVTVDEYKLSGERGMKPDFLKWALLLLLVDTLLTLWMRGAFAQVRRGAAVIVFAALLGAAPAQAQDEMTAIDLSSNIYLAYVETGDSGLDMVSYNGLMGLMQVINSRTTIRIKGVRGVNLAADPLYFYPMIYWPMTPVQPPLSTVAARNIANYMAQGGLVLFDTRDQQFADQNGEVRNATIGTKQLRTVLAGINLPELKEVARGDILTKTFYLLDEFPGAYGGGHLWMEKEPSANNDGVTAALIGGNDWAAAWSQSYEDRARFPVVPGGEMQREMAYRFGVNVMMMALAGNYKSDQVHVPYILERLHRQ